MGYSLTLLFVFHCLLTHRTKFILIGNTHSLFKNTGVRFPTVSEAMPLIDGFLSFLNERLLKLNYSTDWQFLYIPRCSKLLKYTVGKVMRWLEQGTVKEKYKSRLRMYLHKSEGYKFYFVHMSSIFMYFGCCECMLVWTISVKIFLACIF